MRRDDGGCDFQRTRLHDHYECAMMKVGAISIKGSPSPLCRYLFQQRNLQEEINIYSITIKVS